MNNIIQIRDLGLIEYKKAWDYQQQLFDEVLSAKQNRKDEHFHNQPVKNFLVLCEHPHVFTLGKSGNRTNLLIDDELMKTQGISFFSTNRGGDITYHGPGQIVGYPILDLDNFSIGVKAYVHALEEAVIHTLKEFNIIATRLDGATGVWLDVDNPASTRKICAIGVRVSRNITMHGFAFNVNTQLEYYNYINPCGFVDKGVTSMQKELGLLVSMDAVKSVLKNKLLESLNHSTKG